MMNRSDWICIVHLQHSRHIRSGSVFTSLQSKSNPPLVVRNPKRQYGEWVPENLQAALGTAQELFTTSEKDSRRRLVRFSIDLALLHALYLQILHGDVDRASDDVKKDLKEEVLKEWKTIQGVSRERLFVYFASELASRNE